MRTRIRRSAAATASSAIETGWRSTCPTRSIASARLRTGRTPGSPRSRPGETDDPRARRDPVRRPEGRIDGFRVSPPPLADHGAGAVYAAAPPRLPTVLAGPVPFGPRPEHAVRGAGLSGAA